MAVQIVLVGLNHRTAPVELRERVAFSADQARRAAAELRTQGILEETLVLSTCNRSELYGVPPEATRTASVRSKSSWFRFTGSTARCSTGACIATAIADVVRHVFRVAAGLDSMLLGEAEILGQLRDAYQAALELGATGPVLNRMFQGALEVGKRVRTETEIGTRPVSVAFAGVKLAEQIFGKLKNRSALILGAGAVGEQVVERLRDRGIARAVRREPLSRSRHRVGRALGRRSGGMECARTGAEPSGHGGQLSRSRGADAHARNARTRHGSAREPRFVPDRPGRAAECFARLPPSFTTPISTTLTI